jgi:hypothetical protein
MIAEPLLRSAVFERGELICLSRRVIGDISVSFPLRVELIAL